MELAFLTLVAFTALRALRWMVIALKLHSRCRCRCSQEQICELYQSLYESGEQDQLDRFEHVLVSVIKDVRRQQCDNDRLERSYQR